MEDALLTIIQNISSNSKTPFLIAIDGRCAAGKTTLAFMVKEKIDCNVIHMDHFFLQPWQRTKERLQEPGGNVDYVRVKEEVLLPLSHGKPFSYQPFDCKSMELSAPVKIKPAMAAIIEGSYSCHPVLWDFYDLRIFLDINAKEQLQRIKHRNGVEAAQVFIDKWIPMEEKYFMEYNIRKRCDFIF
ncbi:MAG: uridine kinase [Lachnospiraceae bacterium]|nr:uridine kinase [Lachnospiraceae bacterium]